MKKTAAIIIGLLVVVILGTFITLTFFPSFYINEAKIAAFQDKVNNKYKGINLNLNPETSKISYNSGLFNKTHYKIKLYNASVTLNSDDLKNILPENYSSKIGNIFDTKNIAVNLTEVTFIYGPFDKYLAVKSSKSLQLKPAEATDNITKNYTLNIGSISTSNVVLNSLLKNNSDDLKEIFKKLFLDNLKYSIKLSEVDAFANAKEADYKLSLKKIQFNQETTEKIAALLQNSFKGEEIEETISTGKEKQVSSIMIENGTLISKTDNSSYSLNLGKLSFSSKFIPSTQKDYMLYEIALSMEAASLKSPHNASALLTLLDGLESFNGKFAIDQISPELARRYIEMIEYTKTHRNINAGNLQELAGYLQALRAALNRAKPKISLNINPLKHPSLEANVDGALAFTEKSLIPLGKIDVRTTDLMKLEPLLIEKGVITKEKADRIFAMAAKYFKPGKDGFSYANVEIKEQMPYIFINGMPIITGGPMQQGAIPQQPQGIPQQPQILPQQQQ